MIEEEPGAALFRVLVRSFPPVRGRRYASQHSLLLLVNFLQAVTLVRFLKRHDLPILSSSSTTQQRELCYGRLLGGRLACGTVS